MDLIFKGLVGAIVVVAISILSKTRMAFVSGLLPLFPTFAIIAHYISYNAGGIPVLKSVIVFGLLSVIPYSLYLLTLLFTVDNLGFNKAIGCSLAAWFVSAGILVAIWAHLDPKF